MIAQVYPMIRLPRRFSFFDYKITDDARVGDIVRIPFRNRLVFGLVRGLEQTRVRQNEVRLKKIESIMATGFFTGADINRLESIARNIIQSPSTVLYSALYGFSADSEYKIFKASLSLNGLSIDKQTADYLSEICKKSYKTPGFYQMDSEASFALAYLLSKQAKGQLLILLPTQRGVELLMSLVAFKKSIATLHGKTPPRERNAIIRAWQSGALRVLVSTRQGALLPAKSISHVLICESESAEYQNADRNPRFDARKAVQLLAKQHCAHYIETGSAPRVEQAFSEMEIILDPTQKNSPVVINMRAPEEKTKTPLISETLLRSISTTLTEKKQILLVYNKKGVAKCLQCGACGKIPLCGTCGGAPIIRVDDMICGLCSSEMWIPKICPSCLKPNLHERGIGNARLEQRLRAMFTNAKISVIDKKTNGDAKADILLVTEYYFQAIYKPFSKIQFGLVADICVDININSTFVGCETTMQKIHRLVEFANHQKADCLIQTWSLETVKPMLDIRSYLQNELKTREIYRLFPVFDMAFCRQASQKNNNLLQSSADTIAENTLSEQTTNHLFSQADSVIIETLLKTYVTPSSNTNR